MKVTVDNHMMLYMEKSRDYFSNIRSDIIRFIEKSNAILEIGCGAGSTLHYIKQKGYAAEVWGIDIVDLDQKSRLDKFILCDIEESDPDLPVDYFDVIIFADVLEHMINPWDILTRTKKYLKKEGVVIVSLPNFREISTIYNIIIKGDFKYSETGILDKTHLRFFCKKNIIQIFQQSGFKIKRISNSLFNSRRRKIFNRLTFGVFEEFLTYAFIVVAERQNKP